MTLSFSAHPNDKCNELAGKDVRVHITKDHKVLIGGVELPGWIAKHGLIFEAGDDKNLNNLVVRFIVGEVNIDHEAAADVEVKAKASALLDSASLAAGRKFGESFAAEMSA